MTEKAKQLGNEPIGYGETRNSFNGNIDGMNCGLKKREYYAALAMQGLIQDYSNNKNLAIAAIEIADALLEELSK